MAKRNYVSKIKAGSVQYWLKDKDGRALIASDYKTGVAYNAGDFVLYADPSTDTAVGLYKITANITAAANTGWSEVTKAQSAVDNEIKLIRAEIAGLGTVLNFKGVKANEAAIKALEEGKKGDVWLASAEGTEWVCIDTFSGGAQPTKWEKFGSNLQGIAFFGTNTPSDGYFAVADGTTGKLKTVQKASGTASASLTTSGTAAAQIFTGTEGDLAVSGTGHQLDTVTKQKVSATAAGTAVSVTATEAINKGYTPSTKSLSTTSVRPIKSTGTEINYGTADVDTAVAVGTSLGGTTTFNTDAIKAVSCDQSFLTAGLASASLGGTTTFNTDAIKSASLTGTTTFNTDAIKSATCAQSFLTAGLASASFAPDETDDECLVFSTTDATATAVSISTDAATTASVGISTSAASTASVSLSTTDATATAVSLSTTEAGTGTVSLTTSNITPAKAAATTQKFTNYEPEASSVTVATGALETGDQLVTGITTTGTLTPVTAVEVSAQPTITVAIGATGDVDVVTAVTEKEETISSAGKFTPVGTNAASATTGTATGNIDVEVTPKLS